MGAKSAYMRTVARAIAGGRKAAGNSVLGPASGPANLGKARGPHVGFELVNRRLPKARIEAGVAGW